MKRVRVAPGKFVVISTELAEKAARVFGTGLTREQVGELNTTGKKAATGLMAGSPKPLAVARHSLGARPKTAAAPARSTSSGSRRKTG